MALATHACTPLAQVIEMQVVPQVVRDLSSPRTAIRAAACECARSLSRSVVALRTTLMDAGVSEPLAKVRSVAFAAARAECAALAHRLWGTRSHGHSANERGRSF